MMNKFLNNLKETFKEKVNTVSNKIKDTHNKKEPKKLKHFVVLGLMVIVAVGSTYINIKSYIKSTTENYMSYKLDSVTSNGIKNEDKVEGTSSNLNNDVIIPAVNKDNIASEHVPQYLTAESSVTSTVAVVSNSILQKIWPVDGKIVQDYIVDSVVYYPSVGIWKIHPGIDISAEVDSEVVSIMDGTVTKTYSTDIYGFTVEITSSDYVIRYSGLVKGSVVKEGDSIEAGEKIGNVSGEGNSYETDLGAHIHIEVLKNGEYINPRELLLNS